MDIEDLKSRLKECISVFEEYKSLTNNYIIEFFTNDLWNSLPTSWQSSLSSVEPSTLYQLLTEHQDNITFDQNLPQSLVNLRNTINRLSLPKNPSEDLFTEDTSQHCRHLNPKKRHEISKLSPIISSVFKEANCIQGFDFGCGQGHLSRNLTTNYNLKMTGVEMNEKFIKRAKLFDEEIRRLGIKKDLPNYIVHRIQPHAHHDVTMKQISNDDVTKKQISDDDVNSRLLLTGLHACGDLSVAMVKMFARCDRIKALVSVSCCYMKMTLEDEDQNLGYPLSSFVSGLKGHKMNYRSLRIACHSMTSFVDSLKGDENKLKLFCYRAILEHLIRKYHQEVKRPMINSIKNIETFEEYLQLAYHKLHLLQPDLQLHREEINEMLTRWRSVVTFFALGMLMSPLIETIVLLDRCLYLKEQGYSPNLKTLFKPQISPRCHVIIATKTDV